MILSMHITKVIVNKIHIVRGDYSIYIQKKKRSTDSLLNIIVFYINYFIQYSCEWRWIRSMK